MKMDQISVINLNLLYETKNDLILIKQKKSGSFRVAFSILSQTELLSYYFKVNLMFNLSMKVKFSDIFSN
jgi:hypothetical protein